jgi:hypothetical protein
LKKITSLAFTAILLFGYSNIIAQQKTPVNTNGPAYRTCATYEAMQNLFSRDPLAKERFDAQQKMFNEKIEQIVNNRQNKQPAKQNKFNYYSACCCTYRSS